MVETPSNMAAIGYFETELLRVIGQPTDARPFVCDGSPLDCQVFIVGFNPATSMSTDFWQFWRPGQGFDKAAWFDAYKKDRQTRPLKPGKTRRNGISNTRRVIEWILEEASPVRCLETNIYSTPTEAAADLASVQRVTSCFDFLLENIKPAVLLVHGDEAKKHIQSMHLTARVIAVEHFSRGWSEEKARDLGRRLKAESARAEAHANPGSANSSCVFCSLPTERIVAQNDLAIVIRDGFPVSPGHTLVIPRRHVASYFETTTEERAAMLALLESAKSDLDKEYAPAGYNIGINDGRAAGQTVMHLHMHLIPRYEGDLHDPRGGVRWVIPEKADYWSKR